LRTPERLFVLWAGLKGAVPILLGLFIVQSGVGDAGRLYRIIFVVVLISVVVQGGSVPFVARMLRLPMTESAPPYPYATGLRVRERPDDVYRYTVMAGSPADGALLAELPLGDGAWLNLARREGELLPLRQDTRLLAGDAVVVQGDSPADLDGLFRPRPPG
jgi:cell volume regulation protein A